MPRILYTFLPKFDIQKKLYVNQEIISFCDPTQNQLFFRKKKQERLCVNTLRLNDSMLRKALSRNLLPHT